MSLPPVSAEIRAQLAALIEAAERDPKATRTLQELRAALRAALASRAGAPAAPMLLRGGTLIADGEAVDEERAGRAIQDALTPAQREAAVPLLCQVPAAADLLSRLAALLGGAVLLEARADRATRFRVLAKVRDDAAPPPPSADPGRWYAYECTNGRCAELPGGGLVLDLRLPGPYRQPPALACCTCGAPLSFRAHWPATSDGYGSRSHDGGPR